VAPSHRFRRIGFALFLTALALGCWGPPAPTAPNLADEPPAESPDGPAWFEDITDRAGVNFVHDAGDVSKYFMHQCVGSGCAIADLDGDGRPELLLLTNGGAESISANKLYRQKPDGTFEDASAGSGLDFPGLNMGVAVGDVNNDGRPDLAITRTNGTKLLLNLGGLKFADITVEAGVKNPTWGTSVAFLDFDRDGWLDLFVVNYVNYDPSWPCQSSTGARDYCAPKVFQGTASKLFRNRGAELAKRPNPKNPSAAFEDVTVASRIGEKPGPGLGVAAFDADGDGWPDVFVANDGQPNHLWINKRDGTFAEEALIRGPAEIEQDDIVRWDFDPPSDDDARIRVMKSGGGGGAADPEAIGHEGHRRQLADFVDAIRENRISQVDGREGRKSVELIQAICRADETGRVVELG